MMANRGARWVALQAGERTYISPTACLRGHFSERLSSTGSCLACRRSNQTLNYAANPLKFQNRARVYARNNREKLAKRTKASRVLETSQQRDTRLEKSRIRSSIWRTKNPNHENTKQAKINWKLNNPGKVNANTAKRRSVLLQRSPKWLTADDVWLIEQAYELAALRTKLFKFTWHVDHIIPLQGKSVSGLHTPSNLQVIPGFDNIRKANRFAEVP